MATNFLHAAGVTGGFLTAPFTLIGPAGSPDVTELTSVGSTNTCTSANGGTSGKFTQTNFANGQRGLVWITCGGALGGTPVAGANLAGWWLHSPDNGSTYEKTTSNTALARPPDFIIPINAVAVAAADIFFAMGLVNLPYDAVKVYMQNNTGQAMGAFNYSVYCGPVADQY